MVRGGDSEADSEKMEANDWGSLAQAGAASERSGGRTEVLRTSGDETGTIA